MNSESASLYRRHRPRTFEEVVGQEHIVRTLRNAIELGKVHHAYLFVGSRGTGKTSVAKILARSLNCVNGPTVTPCGECESCRTIAAGTSLDVIEMDAASSNSVDDIRDLREKVGFAPAMDGWRRSGVRFSMRSTRAATQPGKSSWSSAASRAARKCCC